MLITIEFDDAQQPISGSVLAGEHPRAFIGWLSLFQVLQDTLARRPTEAHDPTGGATR